MTEIELSENELRAGIRIQLSEIERLREQHHRDSAELRRLCSERDEKRDGWLKCAQRAAELDQQIWVLLTVLRHLGSTAVTDAIIRAQLGGDITSEQAAAVRSMMSEG